MVSLKYFHILLKESQTLYVKFELFYMAWEAVSKPVPDFCVSIFQIQSFVEKGKLKKTLYGLYENGEHCY